MQATCFAGIDVVSLTTQIEIVVHCVIHFTLSLSHIHLIYHNYRLNDNGITSINTKKFNAGRLQSKQSDQFYILNSVHTNEYLLLTVKLNLLREQPREPTQGTNPGNQPREPTQGTNPGNQPREPTQGTNPGNQPREPTQGTNPGNQPREPTQGTNPGNQPREPTQGTYPGNLPREPTQGTYPGNLPRDPTQESYPGILGHKLFDNYCSK